MSPEKFCYWLSGFSELCDGVPDLSRWVKIKKEVAKTKHTSLGLDVAADSKLIGPDYFCCWLSGFCELFDQQPDQLQWNVIKENLNLVFLKSIKIEPVTGFNGFNSLERNNDILNTEMLKSPLIDFN